jgi:hypothetical protein
MVGRRRKATAHLKAISKSKERGGEGQGPNIPFKGTS